VLNSPGVMRRIEADGDWGVSGCDSGAAAGLILPVLLSVVNGPLPLWLASVDIGT
jgi:hypothetical protein